MVKIGALTINWGDPQMANYHDTESSYVVIPSKQLRAMIKKKNEVDLLIE